MMNEAFSDEVSILKKGDREICYRKLGNGKKKILFFHGFPASSALIHIFQDFLAQYDLEVICIDRPGYNYTSMSKDDFLDTHANDNAQVISHLGWEEFELMSVSGGTPHLFHFAQYIDGDDYNIQKVMIMCGLAPLGFLRARQLMGRRPIASLKVLSKLPEHVFKGIFKRAYTEKIDLVMRRLMPVSKADAEALCTGSVRDDLLKSLFEAFAQSGKGPKLDATEYFKLNSLKLGNYKGGVSVWHGSEDRIVPVEVGRYLAENTENSTLHILEGEGHYSLPRKSLEQHLTSVN